MKRFVYPALVLCLMLALALPAMAVQAETGSMEIQVQYQQTRITGGDLIAVRVGYADRENGVFRRVNTHGIITGIGQQTAVTQMQNFYSAYKSSYTFDVYKAEVKDGKAQFADIPLGLYLVYQDTAASGYSKLSSFLVTLPYNGQNHISVASKPELERNPTPMTPSTPSGGNKLPQTGQLTWPVPVMAVSGMALFTLGWWLCFGKQEEPV